MDLETMMNNVNDKKYMSAQMFLSDIDLIVDNALEFNTDKTIESRVSFYFIVIGQLDYLIA